MTTIRPPKGYRLLPLGYCGKRTDGDLLLTSDSGWMLALTEYLKPRIRYARRINTKPTTPTAAQCLRWLAGRKAEVVKGHDDGEWNCCYVVDRKPRYETGRSPLACIRAAIKAERRGK